MTRPTINPTVYTEGLSITQVANGVGGVHLCQVNGTPLSRVAIWQRVRRSIDQAEGRIPSRHPKGWPELHLDDGSLGCVKVGENTYFIHPRAVVLSEEWRQKSEAGETGWANTFTNRGPKAGKPRPPKPYVAKAKQVSAWLKE